MSRGRAGLPGIAFVDFLSNVLLLFMDFLRAQLRADPAEALPAVDRHARLVRAVVTWPKGDDDVDTYVRDPNGEIAYFANASAG